MTDEDKRPMITTPTSGSYLLLDTRDDGKKTPADIPMNEHERMKMMWLRKCLPVFVQPTTDLNNHNNLVRVMYRFEIQEDTRECPLYRCHICIIFEGESSYDIKAPHKMNKIATVLYRSFNRRAFKRTADINYLEFRGVDLRPESDLPWTSIYTADHAGDQQWSRGNRGTCLCCCSSFMHHYKEEKPFDAWVLHDDSNRPIIYLNTQNHMIGEEDNNPELEKYKWINYEISEGDPEEAQDFCETRIPVKRNLYSLLCFFRAKNGGGRCCDIFKNHDLPQGESYTMICDEDERSS